MPGIDVSTHDDGRAIYTISQSWFGTFQNCPQQALLELRKELPRTETDATAIGTSAHMAYEHRLEGGDPDEAIELAKATFMGLSQMPEFRWVQVKTHDTALATIERVYWAWENEVYPHLPTPIGIEKDFDVALYDGPDCIVRLKGMIDLIAEGDDGKPEAWDWKTTGRAWDTSELRWKHQPTVYTYAIDDMYGGKYDSYEFTYAVMLKSRQDVQILTVERDARHWNWLREQALTIVRLIEADLPMWPLRDQHHLCSPKWCPVYADCRGAHGL